MKKTNLIKIFAPVVAIALLIGALVGIGAFAAETPEIVSMNVEYGSELYLYYAVDKASVEGAPALEVVTSDGTLIKTVTSYSEETVNGTPCYIFKTAGIAPGQLNKVEYVRAAGSNGKGDIVSYSVEEYLYTRLFKQGFAAKTPADGTDYYRRNLYFSFLEYGNSAQELFYSDDADKIGDSIFVAVKGNSALSGEYKYADCIKLAAPAIEGFDYWLVTELTPYGKVICERKLAADYEYLVMNSAVIIPVTDDDNAEDVEVYDPTVITFNTESDKFVYIKSANNVNLGRVYDEATGNWYYSSDKFEASMVRFHIFPTGGVPVDEATYAEISFDLYIPTGATINHQANLVVNNDPSCLSSSSTYLWAPFLYANNHGGLKTGAWNTIKIVYTPNLDFVLDRTENPTDKGSHTTEIYVNNMETPVKTITENYCTTRAKTYEVPMLDEIYGFEFAFAGSSRGAYKFDNVSFVFK